MYRILEGEGEVRERRDQLVPPAYTKPELLAMAKRLIGDTCEKEKIQPGELTIHADRGSSDDVEAWCPPMSLPIKRRPRPW